MTVSNKIQEALKSLEAKQGGEAERMNAVSNEIRLVEAALKKMHFPNRGDVAIVSLEVNGYGNNLWRLEYDLTNKRICARRADCGKRVPLLEHKFKVREYMVNYLADLIKALEALK